ncbi:MAG: hypothetical protein FWE57_00020 [Chitinispirillia bacterium]|nr:hypothetical protein [Chitinispirillia bacterium]
MEQIGLVNKIYDAAIKIDSGRKGFATRGKEQEGRISYEKGIANAMTAFKQAQKSADPQAIILAEYTFLSQELHLCDVRDKNSLTSLTSAIESFDEAFLCLELVEKRVHYQLVEKSYPRRSQYRVKGFPKDAFHNACASHRTRLQNMLSATGLDLIEKSLLEQRRSNLTTAQNSYIKKQEIALTAAKRKIK